MTTNETPKRRRTNAEILADLKAEKEAGARPAKKRPRRSKAQIERDEAKKLAEKEAAVEKVHVVTFHESVTVLGKTWEPLEELWLYPNSFYYSLVFDRNGGFLFNKSPEIQKKLWKKVKYTVREEARNGSDNSHTGRTV